MPGDEPQPGRFLFARLANNSSPVPKAFWLVLIVPEEMWPQPMLQAKAKAAGKVDALLPCWFVGQKTL